MRFTLVDLDKVAYKDKPFITIEQAIQVFFVRDSCDSRWFVDLQGRTSCVSIKMMIVLDICETPSFSTCMPSTIEEHEVDDVHANRTNYD